MDIQVAIPVLYQYKTELREQCYSVGTSTGTMYGVAMDDRESPRAYRLLDIHGLQVSNGYVLYRDSIYTYKYCTTPCTQYVACGSLLVSYQVDIGLTTGHETDGYF